MNMNEKARNAMAMLLEFYENGILNRFAQVCIDHGLDVEEAFMFLKNMTIQSLILDGTVRDFHDLTGIYAEHAGLHPEEFARHIFYVPGRDQ